MDRIAHRRLVHLTTFVALVLLLAAHVRAYWFLTDDAFISFRYARNWAEGYGLVFNPGSERVEGYTNFLWVALLAAFARAGVPAEHVAPFAGAVATAVLWLATTWFGRQVLLPPERRGWWWVAPLALAANRSFAVWATSGLETRFHELLLLGGIAGLWMETNRVLAGGARRMSRAGIVLALAVLSRPDALVIAGGAAVASEWRLRRARPWFPTGTLRAWLPFLVIVGLHMTWRLAYYGHPLPNTYYAKLGGVLRADWGLLYLGWFAVEYALVVFVPLWIAGIRAWRQRAPGLGSLLLVAFVPYLVAVVCAGGDHFEFRMLDLLWVPLALLLQSGVASVSELAGPVRRAAAAGLVIAIAALLPTLSHVDFPGEYLKGFPGDNGRPSGNHDLVRAELIPAPVRPAFRPWLAAYNSLARRLTKRFVGLRQEEHAAFERRITDFALDLRDLIDAGHFPRDTRIALHCVGVIPYTTRLWTLDRLGLCDANVAHGPWAPGTRGLAHGKQADPAYIASRGVDVEPVFPYGFFASDLMTRKASQYPECTGADRCWVADLGNDLNLVVRFPAGEKQGRAKLSTFDFQPIESWVAEQGGN